jgi:membrane protein DedA with SNARE-associated domain
LLHQLSGALVTFGPAGIFLLAILDSVGVPLPAAMDALLIFVSWKDPGRAWLAALVAVAGSLAGNVALFAAARTGGRRFIKKAVLVPEKPRQFRQWFRRYGLVTVFIPALLPIPMPLKVFVISAGMLHTPFSDFFGAILLARVIRYFGEAYLGVKLGQDAQGFLTRNAWSLVGIALALAFALCALLRLNDRRQEPQPRGTLQ